MGLLDWPSVQLVLILLRFRLSDPLKFPVTRLDLLLRGEVHHDTIEATLWPLDSTAAHRQLS